MTIWGSWWIFQAIWIFLSEAPPEISGPAFVTVYGGSFDHRVCESTCYINGLEDILESRGAKYPDYMLSVLGGMGEFSYFRFKRAEPPEMVYFGANPKYLLTDLEKVIGFTQEIVENRVFKSTFPFLKAYIDKGLPVIAGALDMFYLHYYSVLYGRQHVPIHYVLVVGYNDDLREVYVQDCTFTGVQAVSYEEFEKALNVNVPGMSRKNTIRVFHIDMECATCHSNVRRHGELTATKASCAPCHHRETKRTCGECHAVQKTLFEGGALGEVKVPKDMMAEAGTSCADCHLDKAKKVVRPVGGACVACHDEKYRATFTEWRDGVRARAQDIRAALHVLYKQPLTDPEKAEVQRIEVELRTIDTDGSSGVHYYLYIDAVLTRISGIMKSLSNRKEGNT